MAPPGETPSNCLWVGNLASDVTDVDLTSLFEKYGMIDSVTIYPYRGFGFLYFRNIDDSKEAKDALQGTFFHGIPLRIRFAKPEQESKFQEIRNKQYPNRNIGHFNPRGMPQDLVRSYFDPYAGFTRQHEQGSTSREIRNRQYPNRNIDHFNPQCMPQDIIRSYVDPMNAGFTTQHEQGAEFRETWGRQYGDRSIGLPDRQIMPEDFARGFTRQHPFQFPVEQRVDEQPSKVLHIRYPLSVDADEAKLYNAMILFGEIDGIRTFSDRNLSLVLFRSVEEARCAKEGLQGKLFNDPRIIIEYSRSGPAYGKDLLEHHTSFIGPTTDSFPNENPYQSAQMSDHNPRDYKWRGIISKCGTFVCNVCCIDTPFGQRMEIPNVINCAYTKGLDMLTDCFASAVEFSVVSLRPDSEKDNDLYAKLLRHLSSNDRAWAANFDDGTNFVLVPPSYFLMKVEGPPRIYGVFLKYATPSVERVSQINENQIAQARQLLTPELIAALKNMQPSSSIQEGTEGSSSGMSVSDVAVAPPSWRSVDPQLQLGGRQDAGIAHDRDVLGDYGSSVSMYPASLPNQTHVSPQSQAGMPS